MSKKLCAQCGSAVTTQDSACPTCGAELSAKTSLLTWIIISTAVLVLAAPFLVLRFIPAEPPEDKTELLKQLEAENLKTGFGQRSQGG